tara:strand:+ start:869 stop:1024 length:156 start_codon:yes stop_codon:yes gene_type:complete
MYSLDSVFFKREFSNLEELISVALSEGVDPNVNVVKDGVITRELLSDFIVF